VAPTFRGTRTRYRYGLDYLRQFSAIGELLRQVPEHLIALEGADYALYVSCRASITTAVDAWIQRGSSYLLGDLPGLEEGDVIVLLCRLLEKCPDEFPAPSTAGLEFIPDQETREGLRLDLSAATTAFTNSEWKAATVLAGAVVEALLLWALEQRTEAELTTAIQTLGGKIRTQNPDNKANLKQQLPYQDLSWFTEVAKALDVITKETPIQINLARNFRNLIHPGRVKREERQCTRGTALSTLAAVHRVIEEFEARRSAGTRI